MEENEKTTESTQVTEEVGKFTQEQVNSFIKREKDKILKDMPSKEELESFRTWKENQKSNEEKLVDLDVKYKNSERKNIELSHILEVSDSGIKKEFREFVASTVGSMEGDFSSNLKNYIKEHSSFLNESNIKTVNTSPKMNGTVDEQNSTNSIMNDIIRSAKR